MAGGAIGAIGAGSGAADAAAFVSPGSPVAYCQLCAAYRLDSMLGGGFRQLYHGADVVMVGYGYGRHAQGCGPGHQIRAGVCAVEEGILGMDVEMDEVFR